MSNPPPTPPPEPGTPPPPEPGAGGSPPPPAPPAPDPNAPAEGDSDEVRRLKTAIASERDRFHEARDREAAVRRELEEHRRAQMSDADKTLADAKAEARRAALAEVGAERADARLRGLLAGKVGDVDAVLHLIGPTDRFVKDDGTLDNEGLDKLAGDIVKVAGDGRGSLPSALRGVGEPPAPDPDTWIRARLGGSA